MIKIIFCLRKLEHLSETEFQDYWSGVHGPLVAQHAQAMGVVKYVQCRPVVGRLNKLVGISRGAPTPYDGVAEIYFESIDSLIEATSTEEGSNAEATLRADEANFIDFTQSPFFIVELHELFNAGT